MGVFNLSLKNISQRPINDCIATYEKSSSSFPPVKNSLKEETEIFILNHSLLKKYLASQTKQQFLII